MQYRQAYTAGPGGDVVYVIQSRDAVKIGVTRNPEERLATLQTGSPHQLDMVYQLPISGNAYAVEAETHAMLGRHRMEGEWFAVPADVAVAAINGAAFRLQNQSFGTSKPQAGLGRTFLITFSIFFVNALPLFAPASYSGPWVFIATAIIGIVYFSVRASRGTLSPEAPRVTEFLVWIVLGLAAIVSAFVIAAITAGAIWGVHKGS